MTEQSKPKCSLFAILARKAPVAAIFRRVPGCPTRLIRWDLLKDTFEFGEEFIDSISVRRCDVSPDGTKLIYFASQSPDREYVPSYTSTWTAVSRLPHLAPIALWPKGDKLAGGGLFHDNNHVWLNHRPYAAKSHELHKPPKAVFVNPNPHAVGEDYPIYANHLERDGWRYKQHGDFRQRGGTWVAEREEICVKRDSSRRFEIEMTLYAMEKRTSGSVFSYRFNVRDLVSERSSPIECDDWADWDSKGRLLYSKAGKLFAARVQPNAELDVELIADFTVLPDSAAAAASPAGVPPSAMIW